jgi:hypothetical protein
VIPHDGLPVLGCPSRNEGRPARRGNPPGLGFSLLSHLNLALRRPGIHYNEKAWLEPLAVWLAVTLACPAKNTPPAEVIRVEATLDSEVVYDRPVLGILEMEINMVGSLLLAFQTPTGRSGVGLRFKSGSNTLLLMDCNKTKITRAAIAPATKRTASFGVRRARVRQNRTQSQSQID